MSENEPPAADDTASAASTPGTPSDQAPSDQAPSDRIALVAAVAATIVAAIVSTVAVSGTQGAIQIPEELAARAGEERGISLPPDLQAEIDQADYQVRLFSNGLAFCLIGVTFAACFGFAFGIAHRSLGAGLLAAALGIVGGAILGGIGGVVGQLFDEHFQVREQMDAFFLVVVMHASGLSLVALATTIAVTFGSRQGKQLVKLAVFAMISVTIAVALFLMVAPLASIERTNLPVPEGITNQAIWLGLVAALLGLTFYRNRPKGDVSTT